MERHKCKLCFRVFPNGRSLGGHMKSHLAKLRVPPPPKSSSATTTCGGRRRRSDDDRASESSSSVSYSSSGEEEEEEEEDDDELEVEQEIVKDGAMTVAGGFGIGGGAAVYGLRENPRKSIRVADPEFSFAGSSSVVQDRESETESRNPTRRRSKRTRKLGGDQNKGLLLGENQRWVFDLPPAAAEQEPVSSVSDTSPEEDVAMCLVMLSRDVNWKGRFSYKSDGIEEGDDEEMGNGGEIKKRGKEATTVMAEIEEEDQEMIRERGSRISGKKLKCEKCMKQFRSSQALGSHRRICSLNGTLQLQNPSGGGGGGQMRNVAAAENRIFQCPYCFKVFGSGQALGGHKRSHLTGGGFYPSPPAARPPPPPSTAARMVKNYSFLDLNFPAPVEDEEFSVVSDA